MPVNSFGRGRGLSANLTVSIFDKPLNEITAADISELCADEVAEGSRFEMKRGISENGDAPPTAIGFTERARNKTAAEVVAFANTYGGVLIVGIEESDDDPKRAIAKAPIQDCEEIARRLRQGVHGVIDPPLPVFEARGVVTEGDGKSGVIILRLPKSRRSRAQTVWGLWARS